MNKKTPNKPSSHCGKLISVRLAHLVAGPSNKGREDSTWSVISGKSSLDQARAVVAHKGGGLLVVTHGWFLGWSGVVEMTWLLKKSDTSKWWCK